MKKKTPLKSVKRSFLPPIDLSAWNFIIFLCLAFILIVFVALALSNNAADLSAKAGISCPRITALPRPESCPGGEWRYKRDTNGCQAFFCEPKPTGSTLKCIPRPTCLSATPRCMIAEPAQGWCPAQ